MILYYEGPRARITDEHFVTASPYGRMFAISELRYIHVAQDSGAVEFATPPPVRWGSSALAGAAAVLTLVGGPVLHAPTLAVAALILTGATSVLSAACWRPQRRPYELWARYHGGFVCLYADADRRAFAQVVRATKRLLEHRETLPYPW
jgi:Family of unknown function (DUF6232)